MAKIWLLYDVPSLLISSMETQLLSMSHKVIKCKLSMKEMGIVKEKQDAVLLFADDDVSDDYDALIYLKDRATEDDMPIFLAGDEGEIGSVEKTIQKKLIVKTFSRPINVKNVVDSIQSYLEDPKRISKKKVLVVDDSGAMLRNVKGWLEGKYQVALANSGAMAIKYLSMDRPDLVLLDYEMPVLDGRQVLQMMRGEMEFADIPVIFLTSKSDKQSVVDVMSLKPEGYLLKTLPPAEIVKTIDDFFLRKKIAEKGL